MEALTDCTEVYEKDAEVCKKDMETHFEGKEECFESKEDHFEETEAHSEETEARSEAGRGRKCWEVEFFSGHCEARSNLLSFTYSSKRLLRASQ